ncbi:MAG: cadherin-like beta sandwich domain-containing protein [Spirochaetales bacterium]|nr:cadherin-like beta sandwich domain-containing protein [Spirochaetales bacterium]
MKYTISALFVFVSSLIVFTGCTMATDDVTDENEKSSDASLASLSLSEGSLTPSFSSDVFSYTAEVENTVESLTVSAAVQDSAASLLSGTGEFSLTVGETSLSVVVEAEDGTQAIYTVLVTRAEAVVVSNPNVVYVSPEGAGDLSGDSWENAMADLQSAMDKVHDDTDTYDQVWVSAGTYTPASSPRSDVFSGTGESYYYFTVPEGTEVYGGFDGSESNLEERDVWANPTILSGDLDGENAIHVLYSTEYYTFSSWATRDAVLDGFTISGGEADGDYPHNRGGGIYSLNFILRNCILEDNYSSGYGGAIGNISIDDDEDSAIENCIFQNNRSDSGSGAIYTYGLGYQEVYRIDNSLFYNNQSAQGGAIYVGCLYDSGTVQMNNCAFLSNSASGEGEVFYLSHGTLELNNCYFSGNDQDSQSLYQFGSDAYLMGDYVLLEDSTDSLYENTAGNVTLTNVSYGEALLEDESDPDGADNVWGTSDDGFLFGTDSPLYNGGEGSLLPDDDYDLDYDENESESLPVDLFGNDREQGASVDLGPWEY